jgi:hypothetical protein
LFTQLKLFFVLKTINYYALKIINNGLLSGQKARQFYTHKKSFIQERVLFVCLLLFTLFTPVWLHYSNEKRSRQVW